MAKTARERAEELAGKFRAYWHRNVKVDEWDKQIADTLTPLLEEIEAARALIDTFGDGWSKDEDPDFYAYDAIRKRNECLVPSHPSEGNGK